MNRGRSFSGGHKLLPAADRFSGLPAMPHLKVRTVSWWAFGSGTVIWRIWPGVLFHTAFAAAIVVVSRETNVDLGIPNVLLTLLGVVIGFVISLRVSTGYDRYWWGRCAWSDIIKNTHTMSRLIWIHVPVRTTKSDGTDSKSHQEIRQVMHEKRVALELLEAYAISLKHHVRGELGIYYEDLYHIVRPLHEHRAQKALHATETRPEPSHPVRDPRARAQIRHHSIESFSQLTVVNKRSSPSLKPSRQDSLTVPSPSPSRQNSMDGAESGVPPYGTTTGAIPRHMTSHSSLVSTSSSEYDSGEREPLLPAVMPEPRTGASTDLVPFTSVWTNIGHFLNPKNWIPKWKSNLEEGLEGSDQAGGVGILWGERQHDPEEGHSTSVDVSQGGRKPRHREARQTHTEPGKHRPRVAGDGENLPLEVLRVLSEWLAVLESRGTVGGNALGGMFSCITNFEDSLATLERILTTPLPFAYSVHISTVWLYLFFLPFQLAEEFHWYTIPGTAVAAFFYLGFIAAGEELEQPFGYDENDLDLDLFCREVITADINTLVATPFPNAPMGSHHGDINPASTVVETSLGKRGHR